LDFRLLDLMAQLVVACEPPRHRGPGHPRSATVRVLATLRRFLREGSPWRSLRATAGQVSGSTLRRFLADWAENAVLAKVHALLVAMLRGNPALILDRCSVRAKRGSDLVGPNPTDRAKMGSKYHVATAAAAVLVQLERQDGCPASGEEGAPPTPGRFQMPPGSMQQPDASKTVLILRQFSCCDGRTKVPIRSPRPGVIAVQGANSGSIMKQ